MTKRFFANINYGSYPKYAKFYDLTIEYKHMLFTKRPIDCLTDIIVEVLKVSSIEQLFDNWMYISNPQNDNFDDLLFDGEKRLITRWRIYSINDDIVFRFNNGSGVYVKTNLMQEEWNFSSIYWSIDEWNSARDHRNIEGSTLSTYILCLIFVWSLDNK